MKEIKFRIFDEQHNEFRYWGFTSHDCFTSIPSSPNLPMKYIRENTQQFTGLFDKNGKEIYEGDIIMPTEGDRPYIVNWHIVLASFVLNAKDWMFSHYFGEAVNSEDCEVIGNIHQDPELL